MKIKINQNGLVTRQMPGGSQCLQYMGQLLDEKDGKRLFVPSDDSARTLCIPSKEFDIKTKGYEPFMDWIQGFDLTFKASSYPSDEDDSWTTVVRVQANSLGLQSRRTKTWSSEPLWAEIQVFINAVIAEVRAEYKQRVEK